LGPHLHISGRTQCAVDTGWWDEDWKEEEEEGFVEECLIGFAEADAITRRTVAATASTRAVELLLYMVVEQNALQLRQWQLAQTVTKLQ